MDGCRSKDKGGQIKQGTEMGTVREMEGGRGGKEKKRGEERGGEERRDSLDAIGIL